jgi:predicted ATPase
MDELYQLDGVAMRYTFDGKAGVRTRPYRGANVGFGVSHVLSVVTALLAAPAGTLLIIEAPEANLHPRAQMELGVLAGQAAGDGVQIMLETHSPYIVSGLGQAVQLGWLAATDASLHYCTRIEAESKVTHVKINERGGLRDVTGNDEIPDEYIQEFFKPGFPGYRMAE